MQLRAWNSCCSLYNVQRWIRYMILLPQCYVGCFLRIFVPHVLETLFHIRWRMEKFINQKRWRIRKLWFHISLSCSLYQIWLSISRNWNRSWKTNEGQCIDLYLLFKEVPMTGNRLLINQPLKKIAFVHSDLQIMAKGYTFWTIIWQNDDFEHIFIIDLK